VNFDGEQRRTGERGRTGCEVVHPRAIDRLIGDLASRQHGVVARTQLLALGIGPGAIALRLERGRLFRLHRGVYLVGHTAAAPLAAEMAAILACGRGSVISHLCAGAIWGLILGHNGEVEVTTTRARKRPGIRVHRTTHVDPRDVRMRGAVPVTSPARTLVDVAALLPRAKLERAVAEAGAKRLASRSDLLAQLDRSPARPGAGALRALLDQEGGPKLTRSEAERKLLELVRAAQLPPPRVNARVGSYEADFLWPDARVIVEVDGYAFHSSRTAFERDRRRDADLSARGFTVIRVTWRQVVEEPEAVVARISAALARASS
jgi:very-short-patch-repair endonuclease/predicted transcriptional regulator of viral defense system